MSLDVLVVQYQIHLKDSGSKPLATDLFDWVVWWVGAKRLLRAEHVHFPQPFHPWHWW